MVCLPWHYWVKKSNIEMFTARKCFQIKYISKDKFSQSTGYVLVDI